MGLSFCVMLQIWPLRFACNAGVSAGKFLSVKDLLISQLICELTLSNASSMLKFLQQQQIRIEIHTVDRRWINAGNLRVMHPVQQHVGHPF